MSSDRDIHSPTPDYIPHELYHPSEQAPREQVPQVPQQQPVDPRYTYPTLGQAPREQVPQMPQQQPVDPRYTYPTLGFEQAPQAPTPPYSHPLWPPAPPRRPLRGLVVPGMAVLTVVLAGALIAALLIKPAPQKIAVPGPTVTMTTAGPTQTVTQTPTVNPATVTQAQRYAAQMVGFKASDGTHITSSTYVDGTAFSLPSAGTVFETNVEYSDGTKFLEGVVCNPGAGGKFSDACGSTWLTRE